MILQRKLLRNLQIKMDKKTKKQKEINKKIVETLRYGYSVRRKIHQGWIEWERMPKPMKRKLRQMFGKYQYIYSSNKGEIDLILLKGLWGLGDKQDFWEIYSNDTLFQDTKRFDTKKQAEKEIKELLLR